MFTRNKVTGDPIDYTVAGDQAALWFRRAGDDWKIVQWADSPVVHVGHYTWAEVKAQWR